jgi:predicted nucleic acid-binding Zn ribbon protein
MTGRGTGPVRLADVLEGVLARHGLRDEVKQMGVVEAWPELVGEHVAAATHAKVVMGGALIVEVRTSAWLMELDMMKAEFLQRVNEHLPETPLERIVFVLAETE